MKDTEFAYAVARVRSNEYKLVSTQMLDALINASDYDEALHHLSQVSGFEDIAAEGEDKMLSRVQSEAFELIYTSAPDKKCLDFLIIYNDFHNVKAILKCMLSETDFSQFLLKPSVVSPHSIKSALESKDFSVLPDFLSECVKEAYRLLAETGDGQSLEIYLDRKCLECSLYLAKESKDEFSDFLAKLMCTLSNVKIALRCNNTNKDKAFIMSALAVGSLCDVEEICECAVNSVDAIAKYCVKLGFANLSQAIEKGYAAFEKACDDIIMENVKKAKYVSLGISPLVAYYFAVTSQLKSLRIVLSCKKNGIDNEIIKERVRMLYV